MPENDSDLDIRMDAQAMYQEEVFTDRRVGTIQRLTPAQRQGSEPRPDGTDGGGA